MPKHFKRAHSVLKKEEQVFVYFHLLCSCHVNTIDSTVLWLMAMNENNVNDTSFITCI